MPCAGHSKEAYAPFGETYNEAGTADRSFTGQDQNVATGSGGSGEYDFLFRKYDPSAGRWMSPDPAGWSVVNGSDPQSLNRYAYVENQPMSLVDPTGQYWCFAGGVSADIVNPGFTCWSDSYGGGVINSPGNGQYLVNGTIYSQVGTNSAGYPILQASGSYFYVPDSQINFGGSTPFFISTGSGSGSGGGGGGGNGPNYTRADVCAASALLNKGGSTFLDALGVIPGEGNLLAAVQWGAGIISGVMIDNPTNAAFSAGGLGLSALNSGFKSQGLEVAVKVFGKSVDIIPIAGNFLSVAATYRDIYGEDGMNAYYDNCIAGKN